MKIALHVDGPIIRGNEKQVIAIARELHARGHEVVASCRASGPVQEALSAAGVRTTGVRPRGDLDFYHALRFALWLKRERPDALLLTSWLRDFVGGWAARRAGVPRIALRVGGVHDVPRGLRGWKHRHALSHYVDAIIANSRAVADHLRGAGKVAPVVVIENGVSIPPMPPAPLRSEFGIPDDAIIVVGVGGLEHRKGFDLLISAIAALQDERVHLVIAGDGVKRESLEELAAGLGLASRVHMPGWRSDVPAMLAAADVFVLSSRSEGMPVALLEAMAVRTPVIAASVAGTWEAVEARDGRTAAGWRVPIDDTAALTVALTEIIADLREGGSAAARRTSEAAWRVANWFTVGRMVDGVEATLLAGR